MKLNNKSFFDKTSEYYNSMINFEAAITRKIQFFEQLKIHEHYAADLGCGTGIDSMALTNCGNKVDAYDPSLKMINLAEKKSIEKGLDIKFLNYSIENIPDKYHSKYSFICSLGNTIANINPNNLFKTFTKIKDLLKDDGQAIVHILNYDKILRNEERIISITQSERFYFVRFYDYKKNYLIFNILRHSKFNTSDYEIISTKLFPHKFETVLSILDKISFKKLNFYESLTLKEFNGSISKDIYIFLRK